MHVEVLPQPGARLATALHPVLNFRVSDLPIGHQLVVIVVLSVTVLVRIAEQVGLRQHEHHRLLRLDILNLSQPPGYVIQGVRAVGSHANHKYVCVHKLSRTIYTKMVVSAGVVDLDVYRHLLDILGPTIDVKHGGLVVI